MRGTKARPRARLRQYVVYLSDSRGNLYTSVGLAQGRGMDARKAILSRFWGESEGRLTEMTKVQGAARNTYRLHFLGSPPGYYRAVLQ
jgi:hypothetical protein